MRFARVVLGLLLALVGLLVTVTGAVAAFWVVGPDDTVDTGAQPLTTAGLAVVTAPDLIDRHGFTLHVTADGGDKPVFVGIGHDLDVTSYLGGTAYTRVVRLDLPPRFSTQELKGGLRRVTPPAGLDWWSAQAAGPGEQKIAWPTTDAAYDVVVMNADGTPGADVQVTLGMELAGLFATCLLVLSGGVVLLVVGLLLMFARRRTTLQPAGSAAPVRPQVTITGPGLPAYTPPALRAAVAAASGMLLLAATGCASVPVRNTAQHGPATRPAITVADGQEVVKRYTEVNNRANRTRDAKLAETVQAGPTLAQTRAGYQIGRKTDAAGKNLVAPFTLTDPRIGAPEYAAYPMRFVVDAGFSTDSDVRQLGVWQRADAGSPWLLTHAVYPPTTAKLPSLDGLRVPTQADLNKLASLPQSAATNLAAYFSGGARSPKASLFTPSPGTVKLLDARAAQKLTDARKPYISRATDTFRASGQPVTFITSAGEALVFVTLTEQYVQHIEPGSTAYWTSGAVTAFSAMVKYTQTLHQDSLHQSALVIPLKGKGKLRILSLDSQLVGAGGS